MNTPTKYIDKVNSPSDLRKLKVDELPTYCAELRKFIVEHVSKNPGHLGSSLGALEITVALHYVFNTPDDKLIWDVGHQAYAHKIITGRKDQFHTNRKLNGISGFPKISESQYDAFGAGHASISISAAVGMAKALELQNKDNDIVAIIGDGAMSGGGAFEGLNNAGDTNILVILNDNHISIDPNVGSLKEYLLKISTSARYNKLKDNVWKILHGAPKLQRLMQKISDSTKAFFLHQGNLFEALGFRYFGPIDGNDVVALVERLQALKTIKGPRILHTLTVKGKGYEPAEKDQTTWHAPGLFDAKTGVKKCGSDKLRYQEVFGYTLLELARENDKIVGITPAMPSGSSLNIMMKEMPKRTFDVGIAESCAVTFSSAMAANGMVPFCSIYSSFAQRAIDNIVHETAIQALEVIYCLDRAGLVGEDGATHHGLYDIAMLRTVPSMIISAPSSANELRNIMYTASLGGYKAGFVIRYPRGGCFDNDELAKPLEKVEIGSSKLLQTGDAKIAVISVGDTVIAASDAVAKLAAEGVNITHLDLRFVKPLDTKMIDEIAAKSTHIITVENGSKAGGAGSAVLEYVNSTAYNTKLVIMGVEDEFIEHGAVGELLEICKLDSKSIYEKIKLYI